MFRLFFLLSLLAGCVPLQAQSHSFSTRSTSTESSREVGLPTRGVGVTSLVQNAAPGLIVAGNSIACTVQDSSVHVENSYYRRYDLNGEFGISTSFSVTSVDVGIESAAAGSGGAQPIEIRLYRIATGNPLLLGNLVPVGSLITTVADASLAVVNFPVTSSAVNAQTSDLVVEVFTPDGQAAGHSFFIGSNDSGQTAPSWLRAPDCGAAEPVATADVGAPDMHVVLIANGTVAPGQPGPGPAPPPEGALNVPTLSGPGAWLLILALVLAGVVAVRRYV